jgi:hypothetical protein
LTCDVAAWRTGTAALLAPLTGPLTGAVPTPTTVLRVLATDPLTGLLAVLRAGLATVLVTGLLAVLGTGLATVLAALLTGLATALTGLATVSLALAGTPPADADDCFGLALDAVPGAAPVLWPPPWPGMMSWVTAWTAEVAALAVAAGDCVASAPDPGGGDAGTLAAGTLAAGVA